MANVNYVQEHILFMEYAADNDLTANERVLWYVLIHFFNKVASHAEWTDDYIALSNNRLLSYLPFKSKDMLVRVRQQLINRKNSPLLYRKGKKGQNPEYKLNFFCIKCRYATNKYTNKYTYQSTNQSTNSVDENKAESGLVACIDEGIEKEPINIKLKRKLKHIDNNNQQQLNNYQDVFTSFASEFKVDEIIIKKAMELAKGKLYPIAYAHKLLSVWQSQGYTSIDKLNSYLSTCKPSVVKVNAQNYTQRVYKESDYNIWMPEA